MRGLAAEVSKNIVLAGVRSVAVLDHRPLGPEDAGCRFLAFRPGDNVSTPQVTALVAGACMILLCSSLQCKRETIDHFCVYTHMYTVHTHLHVRTHTYMYIHTRTHARVHTYVHTRTHAHIHTYMYVHVHTRTHTHLRIHTHARTHAHAHTFREPNRLCRTCSRLTRMSPSLRTLATWRTRTTTTSRTTLPCVQPAAAQTPW